MNTELVFMPGGITSVLQPMDVSINKPFKDRLRQQYLKLISDAARELTETGKIKSAAPSEVKLCVSAAWKAIPESIIIRYFKKCCINNDLDESEDDIMWEEDGEDKDDSDWVTDDDCYEWWRRVWWITNYKYYVIYNIIINKIINYCIVLFLRHVQRL